MPSKIAIIKIKQMWKIQTIKFLLSNTQLRRKIKKISSKIKQRSALETALVIMVITVTIIIQIVIKKAKIHLMMITKKILIALT